MKYVLIALSAADIALSIRSAEAGELGTAFIGLFLGWLAFMVAHIRAPGDPDS